MLINKFYYFIVLFVCQIKEKYLLFINYYYYVIIIILINKQYNELNLFNYKSFVFVNLL